MPYFIAVLALVFVGVGFTLFKTENIRTTIDPVVVTENTESNFPLPATNTTPTETEPVVEDIPIPEDNKPKAPPPVKTPSPTPTPTPTPPPVKVTPPAPKTDYVDGSYQSQVTFRTPEDTYTLDVNVTVANDTITNSSISFDNKGARDSYSKRFASAYQTKVIGQDLGTVSLSRVGGASLTSRAFNNAISSIQNQAKT